jgi:predicted nucleic acid-binding protein
MVVCNTSPIFYQHKLDQLELLRQLFGTIAIPQAVVRELDEGRVRGYEAPDVSLFPWLEVHQLEVNAELWRLGLGAGETEAIALGQLKVARLVLLDDGEARRAALGFGLPVIGTVGVLKAKRYRPGIKAVRGELLPSLAPTLDALLEAGFRLSDLVKRQALESVGETST